MSNNKIKSIRVEMNSKFRIIFRASIGVFLVVILVLATFLRFYTPKAVTDSFNNLKFKNFSIFNISNFEQQKHAEPFRWAFGPFAGVQFELDKKQYFMVQIVFFSPLPDQHIKIVANDYMLLDKDALMSDKYSQRKQSVEVCFAGNKGLNRLALYFSEWSGKRIWINEKDPRPFALRLLSIKFKKVDDCR